MYTDIFWVLFLGEIQLDGNQSKDAIFGEIESILSQVHEDKLKGKISGNASF